MFREDGNVLHFSAPKGAFTPLPTSAVRDPALSQKRATDQMPLNVQFTLPFPPTPLRYMEPDK